MARLVRHLDIERIRSERKITQKELARLTDYPQGFISRMERGKVSTPVVFIEKVKEVLDIKDLNRYVTFDGLPGLSEVDSEDDGNDEEKAEMTDKMMIDRLFNLLEKHMARIERLEKENEQLREELASCKNNK